MSDEKPDATQTPGTSDAASGAEGTDGGQASSPFDHPFFLPALLFVFAAWFGYDGWYNEEIEAVMFNRYGFVVLLTLGVYTTLENWVRTPYLMPGFLVGGALILAFKGWLTDSNEQQLFDQIASVALLSAALYLVVQIYVQSPFLLPGVVFAGALVLGVLGFTGAETEYDGFVRAGCYGLAAVGAVLALRAALRSRGSAPSPGR